MHAEGDPGSEQAREALALLVGAARGSMYGVLAVQITAAEAQLRKTIDEHDRLWRIVYS